MPKKLTPEAPLGPNLHLFIEENYVLSDKNSVLSVEFAAAFLSVPISDYTSLRQKALVGSFCVDVSFKTLKKRFTNYWSGGLGFDLGTANTLVTRRGQGIVINQPSVMAFCNSEVQRKEMIAIGQEAKEMLGRAPLGVEVVSPIREGVISDFRATKVLMRHLVRASHGENHLFKTHAIIGIPACASEIEIRALQEVAEMSGLGNIYFIQETIAASLGAGINVMSNRGNMVVDIGGGTTDVAVIALGGVVTTVSCRTAGNTIDERITDYLKHEHNMNIGPQTAEQTKIEIGTTKPNKKRKYTLHGGDAQSGLPKEVKLTEEEVYTAISGPIEEIISLIRKALENTPPELASDIYHSGMTLVGGGALLRGLDRTISDETGVPVYVAEQPLTCAADGVETVIENFYEFKHLLEVE